MCTYALGRVYECIWAVVSGIRHRLSASRIRSRVTSPACPGGLSRATRQRFFLHHYLLWRERKHGFASATAGNGPPSNPAILGPVSPGQYPTGCQPGHGSTPLFTPGLDFARSLQSGRILPADCRPTENLSRPISLPWGPQRVHTTTTAMQPGSSSMILSNGRGIWRPGEVGETGGSLGGLAGTVALATDRPHTWIPHDSLRFFSNLGGGVLGLIAQAPLDGSRGA